MKVCASPQRMADMFPLPASGERVRLRGMVLRPRFDAARNSGSCNIFLGSFVASRPLAPTLSPRAARGSSYACVAGLP